MSLSLHRTTTSSIVWTETAFAVSGNKGKRRTFSSHIWLTHTKKTTTKKTRCFAVNVQHDADEVFLSILNTTLLQIDDRHLVWILITIILQCTDYISFICLHSLCAFPFFVCLGTWNPEPIQDFHRNIPTVFGVRLHADSVQLSAQPATAHQRSSQFSGASSWFIHSFIFLNWLIDFIGQERTVIPLLCQ